MAELARAARPDAGVGANLPEYSVSELSSAIKRTLEGAYGYVRLRGEISGFRGPHSSGHCYFALKDEGAKIEAVIWKFAHARMRLSRRRGSRSSPPASSRPIRARRNTRSSSRRWSPPASAR